MSVFGIGIDVVEIDRIERLLDKYGGRFAAKVFTETERDYCETATRPALHYAARFCAKEAVAKAFGTGIGADLGWLDMEVQRAASGAPRLLLSGAGKRFAESKGIVAVMISLTHAADYAAANALAVTAST
ncbi:holo-ACP synthase [Haloferula sp. A504]|uniref:holo-ACP synthase n=1 Tax=Haloferula sp. A504 TaxID=3373601 RepID=UPI0031C1BA87|nr:holo-ACP synthase [Verrucomicrobiaceae bacterium E54]